MKTILTIIIIFLFNLTFAQTNDTLELINRSKKIIDLFIKENTDELLKIYQNSEGPKYMTKDGLNKLISRFATKDIDNAYINIDSVSIKYEFEYLPKNETRKAINSKDYSFEFKYPSTNNKYKLDYFRIKIVFTKYWYEDEKECDFYKLYYIDFEESNQEFWNFQ